jgi:D-amino-acid dehydrogenase
MLVIREQCGPLFALNHITREGIGMSTAVVIGGGAVGLLSAYELHRRGVDVTVIDKGEFGAGCSEGNAGWVTPSLSDPVPAPGLLATSLKWLLERDSPLYIRPSSLPSMAPWLYRFWRNCNEEAFHQGMTATARFAMPTMKLYDALEENGVDFEMHQTGLLLAAMDRDYLVHLAEGLEIMRQFGYEPPVELNGAELHDFEPALTDEVVAGLWVREERLVRPETLTSGVAKWLNERNVSLLSGVEVTGIRHNGGSVAQVDTAEGPLEADAVLIAAGAWSGQIARMAGVDLPMQAGKGYNVTVRDPELKLKHATYFSEVRVACSPFDGALRVSGTMELSGVNTRFDPRRLDAIRRGADRCLGDWSRGNGETSWVGMRPMLPDGLPAIGHAPGFDNLFMATGHAMLGITLGPVTGAAIADLMTGKGDESELAAFSPARFG